LLGLQIFNFLLISELASIKQHDNSLLLSKNTKNTWKITFRSMTVAPGKIKVQNKYDLTQHAAQEKVSASTHAMNEVIAFHVFNAPLESNSSITQKCNIFCNK